MSTTKRNNVKISAILATAALMLAAISGCGDNNTSKKADAPDKAIAAATGAGYCKMLEAAATEHFGPESGDMVDPRAAFDAMILISKGAPKAVSADWARMGKAVEAMLTTLDEIGINFADLDSVFEGKTPEGANIGPEAALAALEPVLTAVSAPEFLAAQDNVQKHAKSECDVDLSVGLGPEDN